MYRAWFLSVHGNPPSIQTRMHRPSTHSQCPINSTPSTSEASIMSEGGNNDNSYDLLDMWYHRQIRQRYLMRTKDRNEERSQSNFVLHCVGGKSYNARFLQIPPNHGPLRDGEKRGQFSFDSSVYETYWTDWSKTFKLLVGNLVKSAVISSIFLLPNE